MERSRSKRSYYYDNDYDSEALGRAKPRHNHHHSPGPAAAHRHRGGGGGGGGHRQDSSLMVTTSYRILCHDAKAGGVIGKSGSIIKSIRQHTGAWINVHELVSGDSERIIEISDTRRRDPDGRMPAFSPAQEALLLIHNRIMESDAYNGGEYEDGGGGNRAVTRLVVSRMHVGSLLGKGGKIIEQMRVETKTQIRILPRDHTLPRCVTMAEEIVQVVGDVNAVKHAISVISHRLRESQHRDRNNFHGRIHSPERFPSDDEFIPHIHNSARRSSGDGTSYGSRLTNARTNNYFYRSSGLPPDSEATPRTDEMQPLDGDELVFRILCPIGKIDKVAGESAGIIELLRTDVGVDVRISDPVAGSDEHVIIISSEEGPDDELFPAQEALLHIQTRIVDLFPDKDNIITTRLLVPSTDIGCLEGKDGPLYEIKKLTGASVQILPKGDLPGSAFADDELVQIVGEIKSAREALVEVTSKLRNHFYREISEKDSPPPPEIEPIPSNSITNREAQAAPDPMTTTQQGIQNVATAQPSKDNGSSVLETGRRNEGESREDAPSLSRVPAVTLVTRSTLEPRTVVQVDGLFDDAADGAHGGGSSKGGPLNVFESTSSFCALPLQTAPRGGGEQPSSGLMERGGGLFLSGPIERGALSGPLEAGSGADGSGRVPFSAPLGGVYGRKKRRRKGLSSIKKALYGNFAEKQGPWVVPVLNFVGKKEAAEKDESEATIMARSEGENVQWALGKAGEDRVHVVVSEEQGWLFVGIYDGFNGPDAPEFLMDNLYRAVYLELQGLFWEAIEEGEEGGNLMNVVNENVTTSEEINPSVENPINEIKTDSNQDSSDRGSAKRVTFQSEGIEVRRRRLWEFLAEDDPEDGLDLSGSQRFAFSVDDAISVSNAGSAVNRRWLLLSKLRHGLSKHKDGQARKLFPWRFGLKEKVELENRVEERPNKSGRRRKEGPVEHELVLRAMSRALEVTELAYLDMTDKVLDTNPELALMGSCLLVVLMRDEDVYVMNVGDSRAIVAQSEAEEVGSSIDSGVQGGKEPSMEGIVEESLDTERDKKVEKVGPAQSMRLTALQLSTDHSTSIEEEIIRIKNEHPDDNQCIVNDRLKGRLKVTRAFGAGFLKQPKWNNAVLEMFRNVYIGTAPYLSCSPSLRHHKLHPRDQFLILSSDGLYQYLSNQEVVAYVESFMEKFPDGDPAQHLIEELLSRAAKKAGMDFHELLDIPQGDRRKYHDDVTVMVVSLEGRIWKSSGKYF